MAFTSRFTRLVLLVFSFLAATAVQAQACELTINGDDMIKFDKSTLTIAPDCESVTLTLNHTGMLPKDQMGHNWVLSGSDNWQTIATEGLTEGVENDYLNEDDERIIAYTDLIGGGESTSVTFDVGQLNAGEEYTFFCSFPGHWATMNGTLVVAADS